MSEFIYTTLSGIVAGLAVLLVDRLWPRDSEEENEKKNIAGFLYKSCRTINKEQVLR